MFGTYLVLVFGDSGPLIELPRVLTLAPITWLSVALALGLFPLLRRHQIGEQVVIWWEEHIA